MSITLISHFYNEEMILPFWIKHHISMFDHGILINHGSTDSSVSIIKLLAPGWIVIDSKLKMFDPIMTDFEVEQIEVTIEGWKICLNISEFIFGDIKKSVELAEKNDIKSISTTGVIMVDRSPYQNLDSEISLIDQKPWGIIESRLYDLIFRKNRIKKLIKYTLGVKFPFKERSRLLHKHQIGAYTVGRHGWSHSETQSVNLYTAWFGYSPWNKYFINRKLSFASKLPLDRIDFGSQHRISEDGLIRLYNFNMLACKFLGINLKNIIVTDDL